MKKVKCLYGKCTVTQEQLKLIKDFKEKNPDNIICFECWKIKLKKNG